MLHADRSPADHALRADRETLVGALPDAAAALLVRGPGRAQPGDRTGLVDLGRRRDARRARDAYLCGPLPFMRARARPAARRGRAAPRDIHYEVFGPDLWLAAY